MDHRDPHGEGDRGQSHPSGQERSDRGKGDTHDGILAIRWTLPSGTEIDTGFRADDRRQYDKWVDQQEGAA